jgi:hypothetical protein
MISAKIDMRQPRAGFGGVLNSTVLKTLPRVWVVSLKFALARLAPTPPPRLEQKAARITIGRIRSLVAHIARFGSAAKRTLP